MAVCGLQIFDENGECVLDVTDSLCRILGSFRADKGHGNFRPQGLEPTDRVFAFSSHTGQTYNGNYVPLTIYITDNQTINWRYRMDVVAGSGMNEVIFYGTY